MIRDYRELSFGLVQVYKNIVVLRLSKESDPGAFDDCILQALWMSVSDTRPQM